VRELSTFDLEEVLEILELEVSRKDMVVLGALLKAQKSPSEFVDFESLREQLAKDEGGRRGKDPLIYRSLSRLEKDGFLKIDRSGHTHGYCSSIAMMESAIEKMLEEKLKNVENEMKEIDVDIATLSSLESDALATRLVDHATGRTRKEQSVFAQGWDNILRLHDDKVIKGLKKGDVVRVSLQWLSQTDYMNPKRLKQSFSVIKRGVEFRALDHDRIEREFRENMRKILEDAHQLGSVGYRVYPRKDSTYQFMARNKEGIVLIVSESPLSATWIPRTANPELVDNAIEGFDRDFERGTDLLDFEG
jgi:DNA-binding PadR family transcriptional regulator